MISSWRACQRSQRTAMKKAISEAKGRDKDKTKLWKYIKVMALAKCNGCGAPC